MPIRYDGKLIIPAPFVSVDEVHERGGNTYVGNTYSITLTGRILPDMGSPTTASGWHTTLGTYPDCEPTNGEADKKLGALLHKQEMMRQLFDVEHKKFEIIPVDNNVANETYCYPSVVSMNFPSSETISWCDYMDYSITLETDTLIGPVSSGVPPASGDTFLTSANESWNLEFNDQPEGVMPQYAFRLTHTLSATGKDHYDDTGLSRSGYDSAKIWVGNRLGIDNNFFRQTEALNLPSYYEGYNHVRSETTNKTEGSYEVQETWIIASGNTCEDFTVSEKISAESNKSVVTIEGRINGLETRASDYFTVTTDKFAAANTKFNTLDSTSEFLTRCQSYTGKTLNVIPYDTSVQRNPTVGYVAYNYTYDDRQSNCVSGSITESIVVSDDNLDKTVDIFASIPVLGRGAGPILQDMATTPARRRTVNVDVLMPMPTGCPNTAGNVISLMNQAPRTQVAEILDAFANAFVADQVFVERDNESWNPKTGRYSRNVSWVWQKC